MYADQWVFVSKFNIPEKKVQEPIYHYDKNHVLIKFKVKVQLRDKQIYLVTLREIRPPLSP